MKVALARTQYGSGWMLRGLRLFHHLQAGPILFSSLVDRYDRPSQRRQLSQFFLDILQPLMPLPVRYLIHGPIALLTPI